MSAHPLDRPVWNALSTRQATFAVGGDFARRFEPDVGPLAGCRDDGPDSLEALASLVSNAGPLLFLQADEIVLPGTLVAVSPAEGVQMVAERFAASAAGDVQPRRLTDDDVPAMLALATLTNPGPFAPRTCALGEFWGIDDGDRLVAMAGERMKHDGFIEVSGVCTHPDARGRGHARSLSAWVASRIAERRETPYLHAYASNVAAIALYESLGFRVRCTMNVATICARPNDH